MRDANSTSALLHSPSGSDQSFVSAQGENNASSTRQIVNKRASSSPRPTDSHSAGYDIKDLSFSTAMDPASRMFTRNHADATEQEEEEHTLRLNKNTLGKRSSTQFVERKRAPLSGDDLFMDLARAESVTDDSSEVISRSDRRRVRP